MNKNKKSVPGDAIERKKIEKELAAARKQMEKRVAEYTIEHEETNLRLKEEVKKCKRTEKDLLKHHIDGKKGAKFVV